MLLVINALAFLCICLCYAHMYHSISGSHTRSGDSLASHSDATVAKRMALLVFTDFACWAPIAFFGLTAVAGYPLISVTHSKILLVFFYPLNACTNPYLYALLTKQYRRDLFLILSRYGMCTERAARYRTVFSVGRSDKPRRNGSQSQSGAERLGHRSSGFTGVSSNDQSKVRFEWNIISVYYLTYRMPYIYVLFVISLFCCPRNV
jgi:thyroid stimulating hormone receptor